MKEKTVRYLHKFASIFVAVALVSMFAFPLAVFADPADAPVTDETTATAPAAEETATAEEAADTDAEVADGETLATPAAAPMDAYSLLGGTLVPYTGSLDVDVTTFAVDGGLTGHLTAGRPGAAPAGVLGEASYYVTASDGTVMTFAYDYNSFSTSPFFLVIDDGTMLHYEDVSSWPIDLVLTQEAAPGYTAVSFVSQPVTLTGGTWSNLEILASVTMTPNPDGTVFYVWEFWSSATSDPVGIGGVYALDTMLSIADDVAVYSLGTNQGMYLADPAAFVKVTLPWVTTDGPDDMAAVDWDTNINTVFGTNLTNNVSYGVPSSPGDLLYAGYDSAVYYRYGFQQMTTSGYRAMAYAVGLGLNPAALPATGDSTSLMFVVAGLGILAVGAALTTVAVRRRNRKHSCQ